MQHYRFWTRVIRQQEGTTTFFASTPCSLPAGSHPLSFETSAVWGSPNEDERNTTAGAQVWAINHIGRNEPSDVMSRVGKPPGAVVVLTHLACLA